MKYGPFNSNLCVDYSIICKLREEYYKYTSRVASCEPQVMYIFNIPQAFTNNDIILVFLLLKKKLILVIFHQDNGVFCHHDNLHIRKYSNFSILVKFR